MVHISELSWKRIKHPSEVVKVGDFIEVYIKDLDKENNRISLGYKKQEDNPWEKFKANYAVGDVVKVKIIDIDIDNKRISISMRALLEDEDDADYED